MFICSGCTKTSDVKSTVLDTDVGSVYVSIDKDSDYSIVEKKDTFEIVGGDEVITGTLVSKEDAEKLQSNAFISSDYNVISVQNNDGFACTEKNSYVHMISIDDNCYMKLSVQDDSMHIYEVEEVMTIKSDKDDE